MFPNDKDVVYVPFKEVWFFELGCNELFQNSGHKKIVDIKMFAMVGEKAAPIAVPLTCLKVMGPNSKKFEVTLVCNSLIIRFGSNRSRCFLACISS